MAEPRGDQQPPETSTRVAFVGGTDGVWRIDGILAQRGESLAPAAHLAVIEGDEAEEATGRWVLKGSNATDGDGGHTPLGRPEARGASLIAVRMSPEWWAMPEDQRPSVFEEHPPPAAIAGRLHRCHDVTEPFDLLAWFEYVPDEQSSLDELLGRLRETEQWTFVEREVDIRVTR